jgi:hypothetical protein
MAFLTYCETRQTTADPACRPESRPCFCSRDVGMAAGVPADAPNHCAASHQSPPLMVQP